MKTTCKACNTNGHGMINIFLHPNNIDCVFTELTRIEVLENDCLCIPCYDDMKIANNFRLKCIQSDLIRRKQSASSLLKIVDSSEKDDKIITEELSSNENEITTTSFTDTDTVQEYDNESIIVDDVYITVSNSDEYTVNTDQQTQTNDETIESVELKISVDDITNINKTADVIEEQVHILFEDESDIDINDEQCYECEVCTQSFFENEDYLNHLKTHQQSIKTGLKRKNYKKNIHTDIEQDDDDIFDSLHESQCEYCFAEFSNPSELKRHKIEHKKEDKPYRCSFENCTSQFKEKYTLRNHVRIHSNIKRYKCRYCEHRFHQKSNIRSHERMHTGEKPYICPHCGKAFAESGNLKSHIRFHTGEKPYKCNVCNKSFKTHYSHKVHVRTHTKERPYLCNDCSKSFVSSGKLLLHKRTHSGYRPYRCSVCPAAFIDCTGLKRHSKVHIKYTNE